MANCRGYLTLHVSHLQKWTKAFFEMAGLTDAERQVRITGLPMYDPVARCSSTIHVTYTFDPDVCFKISDPS